MGSTSLKGKKIAILVVSGFEQSELVKPREALDAAGAETVLVSSESGKVRGWKGGDWGDSFPVDLALSDARAVDYDALLLPGGVINPDKLRIDEDAIKFIRHFVASDKPVAAICHGPWPLIESGGVRGRKLTSWPSLRSDLQNAGASWVDEEVVLDRNLVTSRKPDDIPAFVKTMIEAIAAEKATTHAA
ncbi:type 1 glutamine amidotransferase domain-containing protein [Nannocystis bainbridge]|uniref:Type 1 glutamine amidotransferase n=1 Tax=Nannocystis bainbridge TaxID=2995303 RepID=A0ABT5DRW8_9BACT|nr:type 1 glutamine amidotransferase domain-containing protein [Nannocystis bainbridge]MDC0716370.1 type 1 glutamine amidotransferase [Nannocystis bainbridge]